MPLVTLTPGSALLSIPRGFFFFRRGIMMCAPGNPGSQSCLWKPSLNQHLVGLVIMEIDLVPIETSCMRLLEPYSNTWNN